MFSRKALALAFAIAFGFATPSLAQVNNPGVGVSGSPANNDCAKFVVSGGNVQSITTTGAACGSSGGGTVTTKTANYAIATGDCGNTLQLGTGSTGLFALTVPSPSGFPPVCTVTLTNSDTARGKTIPGDPGCSDRAVLWPLQSCTLRIENGAWYVVVRPGRWKPPANTTLNFFTDFTNGSDTAGVTDGLGTGAQAFKTAEMCFLSAADQIDYNGAAQTQVRCNMAAATTDTQGMHSPVHALVGAQGGAAFQIVGASLAVSGAVSNGGPCEITVAAGTGTYSANQIVSVYGVGGATGCNGTWKVTVTDGTHLTLQSTTFGGAYTSGGTVTNGSSIVTTGVDALAFYFGTVVQLQNLTLSSDQNDLNVLWGAKIYILSGNIFAGAVTGAHISVSGPSKVEVDGDYGISTQGLNHMSIGPEGLITWSAAANIWILPGLNPTFSGATVLSASGGVASFYNATWQLNGNTVSGTRCLSVNAGIINSATAAPNTYFPGSSNCLTTGTFVN